MASYSAEILWQRGDQDFSSGRYSRRHLLRFYNYSYLFCYSGHRRLLFKHSLFQSICLQSLLQIYIVYKYACLFQQMR